MRLLGILMVSSMLTCHWGCGKRQTVPEPQEVRLPDSTPELAWSSLLMAMKDRRRSEVNRLLTRNAIRAFESFRQHPESLDQRDVVDWYADFARHCEQCEFRWISRDEHSATLREASKLKVSTLRFVNKDGWKLDFWLAGQ